MQSNIMLDIPAGVSAAGCLQKQSTATSFGHHPVARKPSSIFHCARAEGSSWIVFHWQCLKQTTENRKNHRSGSDLALWKRDATRSHQRGCMASRKANSNMRVAQKYQSPKMHGHMHTLPNLAGRLVPPFLSQSPIACTNANSFNFFGLWMGDQLLEARFFQQWLSSWIPSRPEDIVVILGVFDMNGGWVWCVT